MESSKPSDVSLEWGKKITVEISTFKTFPFYNSHQFLEIMSVIFLYYVFYDLFS